MRSAVPLFCLFFSLPAYASPCPADVGKITMQVISINEKVAEAYKAMPSYNAVSAAENRDRHRKAIGDVLAKKVELGYEYLDAKCYNEARGTFQQVWQANSSETVEFASQARSALNMMDSKGL